jgi:hypothetical protein
MGGNLGVTEVARGWSSGLRVFEAVDKRKKEMVNGLWYYGDISTVPQINER